MGSCCAVQGCSNGTCVPEGSEWLRDQAQTQNSMEDPQEGGSEDQRIVSQQALDGPDFKPPSSGTHPSQVRLKGSKEQG